MNAQVTDHAFCIRIRRNLRIWMVMGAIAAIKLLCLIFLPQMEQVREMPIIWGICCGMVALCLRQSLHCRKLLRDSALLHQEALTIRDERERAINQKAQAYTLGYGILVLFLVMLGSYFLNRTVFITLAAVYLTILVIYCVTKAILRTRM